MGKSDELERRVAALEQQLGQMSGRGARRTRAAATETFCGCPAPIPPNLGPNVSVDRARLLVRSTKRWVNGTKLHYHFLDGPGIGTVDAERDIVRDAFDVWSDVGIGIEFDEVTSADAAEIRIGFVRGDGYWSYLGRDILTIGQGERTMNFGQDLRTDSRGVDVPVHEIGHTLGFPHEHQNPFSGIVWDQQAVIDYFSGPPNSWTLADIEHNVLNKLPASQVDGSAWDPDSIMHYAFDAGLIEQPAQYQGGLHPTAGLSDADEEQVREFYPPIGPTYPRLNPFELQRLSLEPNEQRDFSIEPTATRRYRIQTFGFSDSVMVLFERGADGELHYVDGDDDGGWDRNARIEERLFAGRKYVLRIRLYLSWASGDTAVMLW